jgi:hypothetical protein
LSKRGLRRRLPVRSRLSALADRARPANATPARASEKKRVMV